MDTTHEEADVVLVQQMLTVSRENPAGITVVSDDTDVFVLLLHYYLEDGLTLLVSMESPIKDRVVVDIGKTVEKHQTLFQKSLLLTPFLVVTLLHAALALGKTLSSKS